MTSPDAPRAGEPAMVSLKVRVLEREYPLRVAAGDEAYMVRLAQMIDGRLRRLGHALPTQPDLTHAVLAALEMAEELLAAHAELDRLKARVEIEAGALADRLADALERRQPGAGGRATGEAP